MSTADQRLAEVIPAPAPIGAGALIEPTVIDDGIAYLSGIVAFDSGDGPVRGTVGADVSVELAADEARKAAANLLHRLVQECGSLDAVERILKLTVFVSATPDFTDQPAVANGASQLLHDILGDRGRHARSAVGVASLPLGAAVEIEMVAKVKA